jgi:TolB-like protein/Tfp pilus assembly protein PilF
MSPEQARGLNVDERTDIFSLGVVLYELITGRPPFEGTTSQDVLVSILEKNPPPLRTYGEFPDELQSVVAKTLAKDTNERYRFAKELLPDLKRLLKRLNLEEPLKGQFSLRQFVPAKKLAFLGLIGLISIPVLVFLFVTRPSPFHSLAILPFDNASQNPEAEYLSDGITESIINSMSQLQPDLRVMSRGTVFTYKGTELDPRKVGKELNVDAVVTGRVMQQGDTLIIRANLVNVEDGVQMWGEQFHRKLSDLLLVQDEISQEIADKLRLNLIGEHTKQLTKHYTEKPEAYQFYLKGMYHWYKSSEEDYQKALENFEHAIEKDPSYALAYAGVSRSYGGLMIDGYRSPKEMWPKFEAAAKKALEIDKTLTHGKYQIAIMKFYRDWNWPEAERIIKEILQEDPNDALFHHMYSYLLMATGRIDEGIQEIKICESLDPLSLVFSVNVGQFLSMSGRHDEAIQQFQKTIELNPHYETAVFSLADAYQRTGSYDEAIEANERGYRLLQDESTADLFAQAKGKEGYQKAMRIILNDSLQHYLELSEERYVSPLDIASIYSQLHQKDEAFLWLEKAIEERAGQLVFLNLKGDWDPLRSDPRYTDLVKRIGLK